MGNIVSIFHKDVFFSQMHSCASTIYRLPVNYLYIATHLLVPHNPDATVAYKSAEVTYLKATCGISIRLKVRTDLKKPI